MVHPCHFTSLSPLSDIWCYFPSIGIALQVYTGLLVTSYLCQDDWRRHYTPIKAYFTTYTMRTIIYTCEISSVACHVIATVCPGVHHNKALRTHIPPTAKQFTRPHLHITWAQYHLKQTLKGMRIIAHKTDTEFKLRKGIIARALVIGSRKRMQIES